MNRFVLLLLFFFRPEQLLHLIIMKERKEQKGVGGGGRRGTGETVRHRNENNGQQRQANKYIDLNHSPELCGHVLMRCTWRRWRGENTGRVSWKNALVQKICDHLPFTLHGDFPSTLECEDVLQDTVDLFSYLRKRRLITMKRYKLCFTSSGSRKICCFLL